MLSAFLFLVACAPSTEMPPPDAAFAEMTIPTRGADGSRSSKNGHLAHTVDEVVMDVRYGRPQVKGRTVFGDLVPNGKVWRAGADEATTVAFSRDAVVNLAPVEAGVYSLFVIPYRTEWIVVLNETAKQWGAYEYDKSKDVARIAVVLEKVDFTETFTIEGTATGLRLRWAESAVSLKVSKPKPVDAAGTLNVETPKPE